ncbi:MAG TPA: glycosyltransferase [Chthoniobacterales bacterium]
MLRNQNVGPNALVGIVTRNRATVLPKAIDSALAQQYPRLTVSVINDGSTDATEELSKRYPLANWTNWPASRGYITARNHFIASTDAAYFISLDDDAWFLRGDEVGIAIAYLDAHPKVAVVGFDILSPDRPAERERGAARPASLFIGCGHILRLAALRNVGSYVNAPGSYGGEEKDLALRLMDVGYSVILLPGVHIWHDKSGLARNIPEQHRSGVCNDFAMTLRRTPLGLLPLALLAKLYRHFRFARKNHLEIPFRKGLQLFIRSLPELWKTRKPVRVSTLRAYIKLSQA